MDYQSALEYITSLGRFGSRPGLERMFYVLERLGHPERSLRFVHVGGTNGKGSTTAFLASILRAAGYKVGMYTSPYLESFTDRIGNDGRDIEPERLGAIVARLKPLLDEVHNGPLGPITQFEATTLLAIEYYREEAVDFVAWEVGLGGRLDATNVVTPLVSVITNIGYDHMEVLGNSLAEIAREKAGIIKPEVPLVTAVEAAEAWAVIAEVARQQSAPHWRLGTEFTYERSAYALEGQSFRYQDPMGCLDSLSISLLGEHQCKNAATAVAAVRVLQDRGVTVTADAIARGLEAARWPGRLEIMRKEPLLLVDGAHNSHGTAALRRAVLEYFPGKRIIMVLGILKDKDRDVMMSHLLPLASHIVFTRPQYGRGTPPEELLAEASQYGVPAEVTEDVPQAIERALALAGGKDVVLLAGSLYTVTEARDYLSSQSGM